MNFATAVKTCFRNYATFQGRAPRAEYWYFVLFNVIVSVVLNVIDGMIGTQVLSSLYGLAVLLPGIAVATRRLHDTDRSGWWQLLWLVPIIGLIVLLIWFCTRGTQGDNRFGADPLSDPVT
jgi:uncharacterized membrane protein YhaH (DUF805 family)